MLMWNEKILTTIPRDHLLSGERSLILHWKKHFTELFIPSLAFDVKMPLHLCYGLQAHHLLLSCAQEASLPPGVGMACFPGLIYHLKRELSGRFFCKEPTPLSRSLVFTVFCYNGPIEGLFKTSLFIICCGLDR